MSRIEYAWAKTQPPKPDVYMTRRNESKYLTLRYWDGVCWYEIAGGNSRGGVPFKWPKPSHSKRPSWAVKYEMYLRRISTNVGAIQWGKPYKVYDEKEVLAWMVKSGMLRSDWRTAYQEHMRSIFSSKAFDNQKLTNVIGSLK